MREKSILRRCIHSHVRELDGGGYPPLLLGSPFASTYLPFDSLASTDCVLASPGVGVPVCFVAGAAHAALSLGEAQPLPWIPSSKRTFGPLTSVPVPAICRGREENGMLGLLIGRCGGMPTEFRLSTDGRDWLGRWGRQVVGLREAELVVVLDESEVQEEVDSVLGVLTWV